MAKKRVKSKSTTEPISDWLRVNDYIRRIGDLAAKIDQDKAEATTEINVIKARLEKKVQSKQQAIDAYTDRIESFCTAHRTDFKQKRSVKLVFGVVGWRQSSSISVKKTTLDLIKELFGKKAAQFLRVKMTPDKVALDKLTDEQLVSVDARRKVTDDFFVEPIIAEASESVK